jgi:two-component system, response regulator RegA
VRPPHELSRRFDTIGLATGIRLGVLVVEGDSEMRRTLGRALSEHVQPVETSASMAEAKAALRRFQPELMLLDVELADDSPFEFLREVGRKGPVPAIIAMSGVASPEEAFHLAKLGVRSYLTKPVTPESLERAIHQAIYEKPDIIPHLRAAVGLLPMHEVERAVRSTMIQEALARSRGSRSGAARLLRVSRQLFQHMLRRQDPEVRKETVESVGH